MSENKIHFKKNKILKVSCVLVAIAIFLEVFVFNYSNIRSLFMDNKNVEVNYKIYDLAGNECEKLDQGACYIVVDDIDFPVSSVNIYYNNVPKNYILEYVVAFSSYSFQYSLNSLPHKFIKAASKNYINFYTTSNCTNINMSIISDEQIQLEVEKVVLNESNFYFNFARFICILGVLGFVYYFLCSGACTKYISIKDKIWQLIFILIFDIAIIIYHCMYNEFEIQKILLPLLIFVTFTLLLKVLYDMVIKYIINKKISCRSISFRILLDFNIEQCTLFAIKYNY